MASSPHAGLHLCVFVHGLWGHPEHLKHISDSLREKYSEDTLHILNAKSNAGSFTYDGIELGAERVVNEVEDTLRELAKNGKKVVKISVIGYSLGGLVSRYAIGLLYHKGLFEEIQPVNFTTFATPHLGVRTPLLGYHNHLWNVLGARSLARSGRQLFCIDKFRDTGKPLLRVLTDPNSIFMKALAQFQHRSLYANAVNDRSAPYYTTFISRIDPFVDPEAVKINYLEGYGNVVIDPSNPVSPKGPETPVPLPTRISNSARIVFGQLPFVAFLTVMIPLGTALWLVNAGVQSFQSAQRVRLHEEGKAGIEIGRYRIPLFLENVREGVEEIFEDVNNPPQQEYLPKGKQEPASAQASNLGALRSTKQFDFPTLALTSDQFAMIEALDGVGFNKYPVYIHNDRHSHAAIVVRYEKKNKDFSEGKIVTKHWLNHFAI